MALVVRNPPTNAGEARDSRSITGSGRSSGVRNGRPLQYSCLENSMHRGVWQAVVHGAAKSWTGLSIHAHSPSWVAHRLESAYTAEILPQE